jgi:hypothetical protein
MGTPGKIRKNLLPGPAKLINYVSPLETTCERI